MSMPFSSVGSGPGVHRLAALLVLSIVPVLCGAQTTPAIAQVAWLAGCWSADGEEAGSVEQWLAPAAGSMFGISRTVRAGRLAQFEFMTIRTSPEGSLVFAAQPNGTTATEFVAVSVTPTEIAFENGGHDFPSRVIYRQTGASTMLGRIEGVAGGKRMAMDFRYTRMACAERP